MFSLYYYTCYGGGYHLILPYAKMIADSTATIEPNNFTIISAVTREIPIKIDMRIDLNRIFTLLEFILNFDLVKTNKTVKKSLGSDPWKTLLNTIQQSIREIELENQTPLIKFPGVSFFTSITNDKRIKVITNVLLKQHKFKAIEDRKYRLFEKKPSSETIIEEIIPIIVSDEVKAIFVYPNIVDIPIEIQGKSIKKIKDKEKFLKIVSLDPGPSLHYFKKISAPNIVADDIFNIFDRKEKEKFFVIKQLDCQNTILENFIIYDYEILYKENNDFYSINMHFNKKKSINSEIFYEKIKTNLEKWFQNKNSYYIGLSTIKKTEKNKIHEEPAAPWQIQTNELVNYVWGKIQTKKIRK